MLAGVSGSKTDTILIIARGQISRAGSLLGALDVNIFLYLMIGLPLGGIAAIFRAFRERDPRPWNDKQTLRALAIVTGLSTAISLFSYYNGDYEVDGFAIMAILFFMMGMSKARRESAILEESLWRPEKELLPYVRVTKFIWKKLNIKYAILFLNDRLLFVKVGNEFDDPDFWAELGKPAGGATGSGLGRAVAGSALGAAGGMIGNRLRRVTEDKVAMASEIPVEEMLKLDEKNFQVLYSDIASVKIRKDRVFAHFRDRIGTIEIKGKTNDKFDIESDENYKNCITTFESFLAGKLV